MSRAWWAHPSADVEAGTEIGPGTRIWAHSHVRRGARIGSDCNLGESVFVDLEVTMGSRCKVQNGGLIYRGAVVGDEVFIGPAACLANDRYPRAATPEGVLKTDADWTVRGVEVARGASIGAHAVVTGGVRVGEWAMVGSGAVVTHDVPAHALVVGVPARQTGWICRCGVPLRALVCPACTRRYAEEASGLRLVTT